VETNSATVVLIPHNDVERACRRVSRDVVPSLRHYPNWRFELIIVDNSVRRLDALANLVAGLPWPSRYVWNDGHNLCYGPALNIAARLAAHPILLYLCANHGRMIDPGWVEDLARPFWQDEQVAMTGHPYPTSALPSRFGFLDSLEPFHIQGGIVGMRTDVIKRFPYDEGLYKHGCSDIWQSFRLMQEGFVLRPVSTVISVWRAKAPAGRWKYIHDHFED
jgi:hypothetical protein